MIWFQLAITLLHTYALSLAVGASTFALIFYVNGIKDGTIDPSERRFMGIVYFVLRLALALIIAVQLILVSSYLPDGIAVLLKNPGFVLGWVLIAVIIGNALLMHFHKIPMWLGPVLAGGSWYALFLLNAWPGPLRLSFLELVGIYVVFLFVFSGIFVFCKKRFAPKLPPPTDGPSLNLTS